MAWAVVLFWFAAASSALVYLRRKGRFVRAPAPERPPEERACGRFQTVSLRACDGSRIEGWFFRPKHDGAPLVVMAPGLTGTKEGFYEPYAWAFVERGVAALLIDYRCFGGSEGEPRHWVDPRRHAEDYAAAVAFARSGALPGVDRERIALWGSSFSGGVALGVAAADRRIGAVVAQAPFLETSPAQEPDGWAMARYLVAALLDSTGIAPVYVPALGRPGEWAFAKSEENPSVHDFDGPLGAAFWRALPKPMRGGWENRFLARMLATFDAFEPMRAVAELTCPALLVAAERDDMVPLEQVRRAHAMLALSPKRLIELPCGHFDLYCSEFAAPNAEAQAAFLAEVFSAPRPAAVPSRPGAHSPR